MKALLDINGFTKFIEIRDRMPEIYIPIVPRLTAVELINEGIAEDSKIRKWKFVFDREIAEDVLYYKFVE